MGVARVKQNLWRESWVGGIATVGDPLGGSGRWLAGGDFTYATSRLRGDKNFLVGVWGLATDQQAGGDATAYGVEGGLPERQVGHRVELQAHRTRLRPRARLRAPARRPALQPRHRQPDAHRQRTVSAAGARVPPLRRHRSGRAMGELPRVHRADQLALSQRRPLRVQRQSDRRAAGGPLRGRRTASSSRPAATTGSSIASRSARPRSGGSTPR